MSYDIAQLCMAANPPPPPCLITEHSHDGRASIEITQPILPILVRRNRGVPREKPRISVYIER